MSLGFKRSSGSGLFAVAAALFLFGYSSTGTSSYAQEQEKVVVVISENAYAYHKTKECSAVKKATHEVKVITLEEAVEKMGRRPCKMCYKGE